MAIASLAAYDREAGSSLKDALREWRATVPERPVYLLADVAGYDPRRVREPTDDRWPPGAARALNEHLGLDYPVREGRDPSVLDLSH